MSDEDVFTLEDAKNDGVIKSELQEKVPGMAQREFGDLLQYFQEACSHTGIPWRIALIDDIVRILNDPGFADRVSETEVELRSVKMAQHREEDLKYLMDLKDEFEDDEESVIDVEGLIEKRLQATAGGPMGAMADGMGQSNENSDKEELREMIQEEVSKMSGDGGSDEQKEEPTSATDTTEATTSYTGDTEDENRSLLDDSGSGTEGGKTAEDDPVTPQEGTTNVQ